MPRQDQRPPAPALPDEDPSFATAAGERAAGPERDGVHTAGTLVQLRDLLRVAGDGPHADAAVRAGGRQAVAVAPEADVVDRSDVAAQRVLRAAGERVQDDAPIGAGAGQEVSVRREVDGQRILPMTAEHVAVPRSR